MSESTNVATTGSRTTQILGFVVLLGLSVVFVLAFVVTEPDAVQQDAVRMFYIHVPAAIVALYLTVPALAVASAMALYKKTRWWDITAAAAAELGVVFCGLTLVTGVIWGRPIWNTWWEWGDVRLLTTLVLFLMLLGYLAYRRSVVDPGTRARRSAVIALVASTNVLLVNRSVIWWQNRTLHQKSSLIEGRLEDMKLFTFALSTLVFAVMFFWMMIHRFRIGWLEHKIETVGVDAAIAERRASAHAGLDEAISHPALEKEGST